jgi:hypothetical protein
MRWAWGWFLSLSERETLPPQRGGVVKSASEAVEQFGCAPWKWWSSDCSIGWLWSTRGGARSRPFGAHWLSDPSSRDYPETMGNTHGKEKITAISMHYLRAIHYLGMTLLNVSIAAIATPISASLFRAAFTRS